MNREPGLLHRAVKGGVWVLSLRVAMLVLMVTRLVIVARLLSPTDLGLVGIAILTMTIIDTVTQTGFDVALIQRKKHVEDYLDPAWTAGLLRSIAVFAILQLVAPLASGFFNSPGAVPLIRVVSFSVLIMGLQNIGIVYFRKELQFNKQFVFEFSGRVADVLVAIIAAVILRSVWALVVAVLAASLVRTVTSYIIHPYRPRLSFDREKIRDLFGFGKWILGSSTIALLLSQGDKALIGRLFGATMLGFYQISHRISSLPATEFSMIIQHVTIPAYSKLQEAMQKIKEAYLRVLQVTAFVAAPLAGAILLLAPDLARSFLGEKWMPAVPAMQVLAIGGALGAIIATAGPVFVAVGKPRLATKYEFFQLCVLAVLIYPLTARWGILGAAWAVVAAALVAGVLFLRRVIRLTECRTGSIVRLLAVPLLSSILGAFAAAGLREGILGQSGAPFRLAVSVITFGLVYIASVHFAGRRFGYHAAGLVREVLAAVRRR